MEVFKDWRQKYVGMPYIVLDQYTVESIHDFIDLLKSGVDVLPLKAHKCPRGKNLVSVKFPQPFKIFRKKWFLSLEIMIFSRFL